LSPFILETKIYTKTSATSNKKANDLGVGSPI